jgi:AcrR family transcriptional regulator
MRGHRVALLEGAIHCIERKGYARTTARDVVAASGTNLASIGYHYGSKDALLRDAIFESFRRWYMPLIDSVASRGVEHTLRELLDGLEPHRWLIAAHLEALAAAPRDEELRRFIAAGYDQFSVALSEQLGGGRAAQARAARIIALIDGITVQWLLDLDWQPDARTMLRGFLSEP